MISGQFTAKHGACKMHCYQQKVFPTACFGFDKKVVLDYIYEQDTAAKAREAEQEEHAAKLEAQVADLYKNEIMQGFNSHNYLLLFRHIKENQIFYRTYFKLGYDETYQILTYDYELAKKHFADRFIDYHMEFFKSGLTKMIKLWLQNGCRETPEEMFEILKSEYRGREEFFTEQPKKESDTSSFT